MLSLVAADPSLPPAFFPLPPQRSDRLVSAFWQTFGNEDSVRAWASGKAEAMVDAVAAETPEASGEPVPTVEVVEEVAVKGDGEALIGGERQTAP